MHTRESSGDCIGKASCPECGSGDGVQIFQQKSGKQDAFCFACETKFNKVDGLEVSKEVYIEKKKKPRITMEDIAPLSAVDDRGIRSEIYETFGVKMGFKPSDPTKVAHHFYPSFTQEGKLQGYDHRICDPKGFNKVGDTKDSLLFGQNICRTNKKLFVTEGHVDALSLYQVLLDNMAPAIKAKGYTPSVVSLTNGISGAVKELGAQSTFLSKFKEIILVFDTDAVGKKGAEKVAQSLDNKVLIADIPLKDANEMLLADRGKELQEACLYNAMPYEPDGIVNAVDSWERYKHKKDTKCFSYPPQFEELNKKTYGWRLGSVNTITSGSGMGCANSPFIQQCMSKNLSNSGDLLAA